MDIIPAIDVIDGRCVRLTQGDFRQVEFYDADPLEAALRYEAAGIRRLHLVDLDGAKTGAVRNHKVLEKIAARTTLRIDFGGGVQTTSDMRLVLDSGARQISIGSIAVKNKPLFLQWIAEKGAETFLLSVDARDEKIAVDGWQTQTRIEIDDFVSDYLDEGVTEMVCTDIARDGAMRGPALALYTRLVQTFPQMRCIASGGVSAVHDLERCAESGVAGVIIGKALYNGTIQLDDLRPFLQNAGSAG